MTLATNDLGALVYIARRTREETTGASTWDAAGIAAGIRRMIDRGFGFDEILDQIVNHARDKSAKNPGVLGHPVTGRPAEPRARRNPSRDQQCGHCGLWRHQCVCPPTTRQAPDSPEVISEQRALARAGIAAAKGVS